MMIIIIPCRRHNNNSSSNNEETTNHPGFENDIHTHTHTQQESIGKNRTDRPAKKKMRNEMKWATNQMGTRSFSFLRKRFIYFSIRHHHQHQDRKNIYQKEEEKKNIETLFCSFHLYLYILK